MNNGIKSKPSNEKNRKKKKLHNSKVGNQKERSQPDNELRVRELFSGQEANRYGEKGREKENSAE